MLILGHTLAGACDEVPGRFHVATRFFTAFFVPVVPLQGWLVTSQNGERFSGHLIPISVKSLLLGYLRGALFAGGLACLLFGLFQIYLYFADGRPPVLEGLKFLGGWVLLWASGVASYYFGRQASYHRAVQLALMAGVPPEVIAQQYQQPLPDADTLRRLRDGILPQTSEGKSDFGPVGRFFTFLFFAWIAVMLLGWGGLSILKEGHRGWTTCLLWGIALFFGLLCLAGAGVTLFRLSGRTRDRLLIPVALLTLLAVALGPWASRWYWQPKVEEGLKATYAEAAKNTGSSFYGSTAGAPYSLMPPSFFLVTLLVEGRTHHSMNDEATLSLWGGDPHFEAVQKLAKKMASDTAGTDLGNRDHRLALLKKVLPKLQAGEWPEEIN